MMQDYLVKDIILNKEQSESLIDNILHPQDGVLDRRDAFLAEVQRGIWQHHTESSFSVELPNLDLSFINSSEAERGEIIQSLEFNLKEPDVYTNLVGKANINRTSPKRLQFSNPSLTALNFQINEEFEKETGKGIEFNIESEVKISKSEKENVASVELVLAIGEISEKSPFFINISEAAGFKWDDDIEDVDKLLSQNAPALLLSYMRPTISMVTAASKYPAYNLPYINFIE